MGNYSTPTAHPVADTGWIQTATGGQFWPLAPRVEDVRIEDIAHALARLCRYGGHCRRFYSVAEHSVLLSRAVAPEHRLWALLHDAGEAYLVDVPRPLKEHLAGYQRAEERVLRAICERFGLSEEMPEDVRAADTTILCDEADQNMAPPPAPWPTRTQPLGVTLQFWTPEQAQAEFLAAFVAYTTNSNSPDAPAPCVSEDSRAREAASQPPSSSLCAPGALIPLSPSGRGRETLVFHPMSMPNDYRFQVSGGHSMPEPQHPGMARRYEALRPPQEIQQPRRRTVTEQKRSASAHHAASSEDAFAVAQELRRQIALKRRLFRRTTASIQARRNCESDQTHLHTRRQSDASSHRLRGRNIAGHICRATCRLLRKVAAPFRAIAAIRIGTLLAKRTASDVDCTHNVQIAGSVTPPATEEGR